MPGLESTCPNQRRNHQRRNLRNRFEVVRTLGQGTYGKVKLAIERETGEPFAIKTVRKKQIGSEQDLNRVRREIEIMTRLHHPHIISVYEVFENADKIILVMEYASGGELYDHCNDKRGLYDDEARKFFRQIVSAVHYLHKNGIVHRDLKLENIVLDHNGDVKIADFGFANICNHNKLMSTFCGSPLYASPEIVNGLPYHGPEVDCWSLGVLLYAMAYGAMPFDGSDFRRLRNQITAGDYFRPGRPSDAEGLISQLLCPNAARRYTIDDVISHWWVNLGYEYNPVNDSLPGKPVDHSALVKQLSVTSPAKPDTSTPSGGYHGDTRRGASQPPSSSHNNTPPIKSILKNPKKPVTSKPVKSHLQKSRSLDVNINIAECSVGSSSQQTEAAARNASPAFDSRRKPKKGILKKRHSDVSGECELHVATDPDTDLTLASRGGESHGSSSPHSAHSHDTQGSESESDTGDTSHDPSSTYDLGDIEDVLDSIMDNIDEHSHSEMSGEKSADITEDSGIVGDLSSPGSSLVSESSPGSSLVSESDSKSPANSVNSAGDLGVCSTSSTPSTHVLSSGKRRKGMLKSRQADPSWRHSSGSQGSTSSADLLDFSYDSGDGDTFFTEYFTMPLNHAVVPDDPGPCDPPEEDIPPPLPNCPPPDYVSKSCPDKSDYFSVECANDDIVEKIVWLGNEDSSPSPGVEGGTEIDWDEVEDIYRQALELQQAWT